MGGNGGEEMKIVVASSLLLAFTFSYSDFPFYPNVEISNDPFSSNQNETGLAVDYPYIYCDWNDNRFGTYHVGYTRSEDGGNSFENDTIFVDYFYEADGDPVVQVDDSSNVYVLWLSFSYQTNYGRVVLIKSYDRGITWPDTSIPSGTVSGYLPDKPWFRIRGDTVYVVYANFNTFSWLCQVTFTRSLDRGTTFEDPIAVSGYPSYVGLPFFAVDKSGTIYVIWYNSGSSKFYMAKSYDGGESFTSPFPLFDVYFTWNPDWRAHPLPCLEAGGSDTLYLTWLDSRFGSWDVLFSRSTDGGASWSTPIKVNDDTGYALQNMPMLACDPGGGIHLVWYDRRSGNWDIRYSRSLDKGISFEPNRRVSDASFSGEYFMGDYMGIFADNVYVYVTWSDGRDGDQDIYFSKAEGLVASICGDTDGDGEVSSSDAVNTLLWLLGLSEISSCWAANVDGTDGVSASDAIYLLQWLTGGSDLNCQPCE